MSSFVWIDHSEKQRRQVLDAIDQFREKDTRDELGIATIRDAISDTLFPGTGALQTRARYFFFVPWTLNKYADGRSKSGDIARKVRDEELRLIEVLSTSETPAPHGIIGIRARKALQRAPSSIYWNGLKVLGFCRVGGSLWDYLKHVERAKAGRATLRDDDGDLVEGLPSAWVKMPAMPDGFPEGARLPLQLEEAVFLKNQVIAKHPSSLFAFFLQENTRGSRSDFAWDHPATDHVPATLKRKIEYARIFSEVLYGAPIIYNLGLARMAPPKDQVIADCLELLDGWRQILDDRQAALASLEIDDFWAFVHECDCRPTMLTKAFVERWFAIASDPARRKTLGDDTSVRDLVFAREQQIKGQLARSLPDNRRAREIWQGGAGLGRLIYRWDTAATYLSDIADALNGSADA